MGTCDTVASIGFFLIPGDKVEKEGEGTRLSCVPGVAFTETDEPWPLRVGESANPAVLTLLPQPE